jgi:alpha-tubulin suppressor-like RCC1 family protein
MTLITRRVAAVVVTALTLICAVTADAQSLAGGATHSVFLTSSGTVWTVGSNSDGQLGDNTLTTRKVPVAVGGLTKSSRLRQAGTTRSP